MRSRHDVPCFYIRFFINLFFLLFTVGFCCLGSRIGEIRAPKQAHATNTPATPGRNVYTLEYRKVWNVSGRSAKDERAAAHSEVSGVVAGLHWIDSME